MKRSYYALVYMGLAGMTILIATLSAISDKLVTIGPWVLGVLLTMVGLLLIFYLYKLYAKFRHEHLTLQERIDGIESGEQELRIANERWEVERTRLFLRQHLKVCKGIPS